jgi:ATP-dependent protease ClpP protease subunit
MPFIDLPDRIPGLRAQARTERPWYQFRNVAADEAELFLYDEIGGYGTYAEDFIAELKAVTSPKLRVRVSSPGGSVFEGVAVANALRAHPANVTVQVDGIAASIASVIAMAGDRVVVQPQAMIMCHDAAGVCLGNARDMQDMANLLDKISDNIADAYTEKAGGTRDEWRSLMRDETWFTAEEAVKAGLADEMLPARKQKPAEDEPEMRRDFDLAAYGYAGPAPATGGIVESPPVVGEDSCTLTIPIGSALGEQLVAALRASVAPAVEPAPEVAATVEATPEQPVEEPAPAFELRGEHGPELLALTPEPAAPAEEPTPEPVDAWADMVAHLTKDEPDAWSVLVSNLTTTASSSAATEA